MSNAKKRKSQGSALLASYRIAPSKLETCRMDTGLAAEGDSEAVMPTLKSPCIIIPILLISAFQPRCRRRRVGRLLRVFFLATFLHGICKVLENASFPIRKRFDTQVPVLSSKQRLHEMWLPRTDVQESPPWHQDARDFLEISVDVLPDVVRWIPHGPMEPRVDDGQHQPIHGRGSTPSRIERSIGL